MIFVPAGAKIQPMNASPASFAYIPPEQTDLPVFLAALGGIMFGSAVTFAMGVWS